MSWKYIATLLLIIGIATGHAMGQTLVPMAPATLTDGHVYLLEDETDSSANNNTGVIMGAPLVVDGLSGKAMQFNGTSDGIQMPNIATINLSTHQNKTVIAVFNCADVSKSAKQVVFEEGGTTRGMNIYVHEGLAYAGGWNPADYTPQWPGTFFSAPIEPGQWHVVVGILRSGGAGLEDDKFEMWMDGVLIGKGPGAELRSRSNNCGIGYQDSQTKFHDGNVSATGSYFEGIIDEVWIINEALSEDVLSSLGPAQDKAKEPLPEDGAVDVWRTGTLAWEAGKFAKTHHVYLGTDLDDVNTATIGVSMGQADTTYNPGVLAFNQTYYWRVDEVNSAPDRTVFKGDIWSFTVEPTGIPVTNITATASGENPAMGPENTVNGSGLNAADEHTSEPTTMWLAAGTEVWIQYEFDQAYPLHEILVWNSNQLVEAFIGFGIKEAVVETSLDGETWMAVEETTVLGQGTGQDTYTSNTTITMNGIVARFVKITSKSAYGLTGQMGLSEVRFLYIPTVPRELLPADGGVTENVAVALSWRPGRQAASHQIYLGTDPSNLVELGTTEDNSLVTDPLDYNQTYYWQVIAINDVEAPATYASAIQSFNAPPFGSVDDFEAYSGDEGEEVFMTWFDGFGGDASLGGSTTGLIDGPFVETTVVHGGDQSLPIFYDNNGSFVDIDGQTSSPNFSEVERAFDIAQDWTAGTPTTLVLWIHGNLSNSAADQLYVKINNTKVIYDGDLSVPIWRPWHIDLSTLGTNLGSIRTLGIGVDGSGEDMVHVDDIALYRTAPAIAGPPAGSDPSLVAHWKLDETEGMTATDSSGYGNHGTLMGMDGTEWTAGILDGALELAGGSAGTPKYVDFGNSTSLQLFDSATISTWVKMNEGNADVYMGIGGKLISGYYQGFALVRHSSNVFRLWCDDGAGVLAGHEASSDDAYTDTEWHHVAGVIDNGTSVLYVDGVRQAQEGVVNLTDSGGIAYIGKQYGDDSSHRYWNGLIDEVRIYYRALSAQEISGL
jgi:hypothetical protein